MRILLRNILSRSQSTHFLWALISLTAVLQVSIATAQGQGPDAAVTTEADSAAAQQQDRFDAFQKLLSGSKMIGQFTIDGKDGELKKEEYHVKSIKKLADGDLWLFNVRIRYGDHDVTVPLPLPVIWADNTPVITVDNVAIPLMGTFSARVVIADGKYAGTWQHGEVGGHLFGRISAAEAEVKTKTE